MVTTTRHRFELPRFEAPPVPALQRRSVRPTAASSVAAPRAAATVETQPVSVPAVAAAVPVQVPLPVCDPAPADAPSLPSMHRDLVVMSLPARPRRDGVLALAVGSAIAIGLFALVLAMATGVTAEW